MNMNIYMNMKQLKENSKFPEKIKKLFGDLATDAVFLTL